MKRHKYYIYHEYNVGMIGYGPMHKSSPFRSLVLTSMPLFNGIRIILGDVSRMSYCLN